MSLVNFTAREITCKIVYYGPGRSGKTTNLQYVYGRVPDTKYSIWKRSPPWTRAPRTVAPSGSFA